MTLPNNYNLLLIALHDTQDVSSCTVLIRIYLYVITIINIHKRYVNTSTSTMLYTFALLL